MKWAGLDRSDMKNSQLSLEALRNVLPEIFIYPNEQMELEHGKSNRESDKRVVSNYPIQLS